MAADELFEVVWWTQSLNVEFKRLKDALEKNKPIKEIDSLLNGMIERAEKLIGKIKGARRLILKLKILRIKLERSIKNKTHNLGWRLWIINRIETKIQIMYEDAVHAEKQKDYDKVFAFR